MASFDHISGAEPSTVTFKLATVTQTRNSSKTHSEIMVLGDPDTSNAIAAVLAGVPASTAWGLVVRQVGNSSIQGNSTVFQGTSPWVIAGNSTVAPLAGSTWATRPIQSSAADLQMTATQGTSPWIIAGNSSVVIQSGNSSVTISAGNSSVTISAGNSSVIVTSGNITSTCVQGTNPWIIAGNSTVAPLAGSTWATRPIQSSAADLQMTATPAAGSTWATRPIQSSQADLRVTAYQSSASEFKATISPSDTNWASSAGFHFTSSGELNVNASFSGSTIVTVSTVQGAVIMRSSKADALMTVYQSSASEFLATVTIGTNLQSTVAPSSNSSGVIVRQVVDNILTTASTDAFGVGTTSFSIQSSGAGLRSYVTAYSILTTNAGPTKIAFFSSATMTWPLILAAVSSAVTGANLAVSAPAYLFRTANQEALTLRTKGSSIAGWHVAVSYFRAP